MVEYFIAKRYIPRRGRELDSLAPVVAPVVQAAGLKAVRPDQNDDDDLR